MDQPPPKGYARWTGPLRAKALKDVDVQYVWRFLPEHKTDLAARKSWCESNDPEFTSKAADVVGLYVAPPEKAIVLCVDEKASIQAPERTLPSFGGGLYLQLQIRVPERLSNQQRRLFEKLRSLADAPALSQDDARCAPRRRDRCSSSR